MDSLVFNNTYKKAVKVLRNNTYTVTLNGKVYRRIVPSKEFYVHQWNWDSATHAMGLVHIDEDLAFDEIRSLLSGQWENGLVPQITFNPHEKKYFPGPRFWGTEKFKTGEIITSGITQPPLLAVSVGYVVEKAKNRKKAAAFREEVLPKVVRYHQYLKTYRDPENSGLLIIVHPWESGTDNSPQFDEALESIRLESIPEAVKKLVDTQRTDDKEGKATHRPRIYDYYRYMYLIGLFKSWKWNYKTIVSNSPFVVKDVLFNSIWSRANRALAGMLRSIGREEAAVLYESWSEQTNEALLGTWDEQKQIFQNIDISLGKRQRVSEDTITSFLPLYAGAVKGKGVEKLLKKLTDDTQYRASFPVPSASLANPKFDVARYWRGPTWPITNLFIIDGLDRFKNVAQVKELQQELVQKTMQVISKKGFYEYYDPFLGFDEIEDKSAALGFGEFSWTAAIYIYLYHTYVEHNLHSLE